MAVMSSKRNLRLVSASFYQICIFSSNDSPLKTMKNPICGKNSNHFD